MRTSLLSGIVIALLAAGTAVQAAPASLSGVVVDAQGQPLQGVTVRLEGPGGLREAHSDAAGTYRFETLLAGGYRLRFEKASFRPASAMATIVAESEARLDARLEIALVETLTVTTQRREESLQDVPVSVTALSTRTLEESGVTDLSRLSVLAPGLNVGRAGEDARPALRGARTENIGAVNDPVVGFHVDGVPRSRFSQALHGFVDVERVEVQRGPQGTLFGRNSFGGNVNVVSQAPQRPFDYGVSGGFGAYARRRFEGFLNVPLGDRVQFRLAGLSERRDGYVENTGSGPDFWDEDLDYLRASLRLRPAPGLDVVARFTHWDQGGNGQGDFGSIVLGTLRDPASGRITLDGALDPVSTRRGAAGAPLDEPFRVARDIPLLRDNAEDLGTLSATWKLGQVELRSISSLSSFGSLRQNDGDFSANVHATEYLDEAVDSISQELQVGSRDEARLQWLAGAFYQRDNLDYRFLFDRLTRDVDTDGNPETASAPGSVLSPGVEVQNLETLRTTSRAAFGHLRLGLTSKLRLSAGLRFTRDEKVYSFLNELNGQYNTGFQGTRVKDLQDTWSKTTWRAGADYRLSGDHLLYASVATGFVAGGFAVVAPTLVYGPQHVTAYEVGAKSQFRGRTRLDLAVYRAEYSDLLANAYTTFPDTGAFFIYQTNAGAVTSTGLEVEVSTVPVRALTLQASLALQDATYGTFILPNPFPRGGDPSLPGNLVSLQGNRVQQQPAARLSVGASYEVPLHRAGTLLPQVRTYLSSEYGVNDVVLGRDRVSVQGGFTRTDLRLAWTHPAGRLRAEAFVENLEDATVLLRLVRGGDDILQGGYAPPRTWGVKLSYRR